MGNITPAARLSIQPAPQVGTRPEPALGPARMGGFIDRGFLVLADISGFTAFVTATELEHGPQIIATLLEKVMGQLSPPLEIQEVEGDAVFALGPDRTLQRPGGLLDCFGNVFVAFREGQREASGPPPCSCGACERIPTLSLKIVAHYGSFLRHTVGGRAQAAGPNVILAHRLLKNRVDRRGGYLLLTDAARRRMGVDPTGAGWRAHTERYEHLGEIPLLVGDIESVWADTSRSSTRASAGESTP
jgi:hypothetical protein